MNLQTLNAVKKLLGKDLGIQSDLIKNNISAMKFLLNSEMIEDDIEQSYEIVNYAIGLACENGYDSILKLILQDDKTDICR